MTKASAAPTATPEAYAPAARSDPLCPPRRTAGVMDVAIDAPQGDHAELHPANNAQPTSSGASLPGAATAATTASVSPLVAMTYGLTSPETSKRVCAEAVTATSVTRKSRWRRTSDGS
jgi:hypothetical protein